MAKTKKTNLKTLDKHKFSLYYIKPFKVIKRIDFTESYVSLSLGIFSVFVFAFITLLFFGNKSSQDSLMPQIIEYKTAMPTVKTYSINKSNFLLSSYLVQNGDNLRSIALKFYKTEDKWKDIAYANGIDTPDSIYTGQKLTIPH